MFRFQDWPVYKATRDFRKKIKTLSKKFPRVEQYALTSQLWRALDSIALNIAEGSDRYSDIDFSRFLNNALTSLYEVVSCLDLALDDGYITIEEHRDALQEATGIARQLSAFSASVRNSVKSKVV